MLFSSVADQSIRTMAVCQQQNDTVRSAWTSGEFGGGVNEGRFVEGAWASGQ